MSNTEAAALRGARRGLRALCVVASAALIAACGGGGGDEQVTMRASSVEAPVALSQIVIERISLKAERRVSRTVYEYDYAIVVRNSGPAASGVVVELVQAGPGTTIVNGTVALGDLLADTTMTPAATIRLRHDRTLPFRPEALAWSVGGRVVEQMRIVAVLRPEVRRITDAAGTLVSFPDVESVRVAPGVSLAPGDVAVYNERALRLGTLLNLEPSGHRHFVLERPELAELYSKLEIDGTASIVQGVSGNSGRKRFLSWLPRSLSCAISNTIAGRYLGATCNFEIADSELASPKVKGSYYVGANLEARTYDFVSGTGSLRIDVALGGNAALELSRTLLAVGTMAPNAKDEVCSTALRNNSSSARMLLVAPQFPLGPGVTFNVPMCIAAGAKVNVAGEILSLAPRLSFSVLYAEGSVQLSAPVSAEGQAEPAAAASALSLDASRTGASAFKLSGSGEVAAEVSAEVGVLGLAYSGLAGRLAGSADVEAKIAPAMVGLSKTLGELRASPQACGTIDLAARFKLDAFAQGAWLLASQQYRSPLLDLRIGDAYRDRFGICGRSSVKVDAIASANPVERGVPFKVRAAVAPAPTEEEIVYDDKPKGDLVVRLRDTGQVLCTIADFDKKPVEAVECTSTLSSEGQYAIEVAYAGDANYKGAVSAAISVRVGPPGETPPAEADFEITSLACSSTTGLIRAQGTLELYPGESFVPSGQRFKLVGGVRVLERGVWSPMGGRCYPGPSTTPVGGVVRCTNYGAAPIKVYFEVTQQWAPSAEFDQAWLQLYRGYPFGGPRPPKILEPTVSCTP